MIADSAQAVGGKLYVLGGGVSNMLAPPAPIALCGTIVIPWDETNNPHTMTVLMENANGEPVMVSTPLGEQPFKIEAMFEGGRPPGAAKGTSFTAPIAMNFVRPPAPVGRYVFRILSDGKEVDQLALDIVDRL